MKRRVSIANRILIDTSEVILKVSISNIRRLRKINIRKCMGLKNS